MTWTSSTRTAVFSALSATPSVAIIIPYSAYSVYRVQEPQHDWRKTLVRRLDELCSLPEGWDGYGALPVAFSNANFVASLLGSACPINAPLPQIVPGPNGDLQIEWHSETSDIELHIRAPYNVDAWRSSPQTPDTGEEVHLTADFTLIARWLEEFSGDQIAARSSAA